MIEQIFTIILLNGIACGDVEVPKLILQELTTVDLNEYQHNPFEDVSNVAGFGDAEHRGNLWYSFHSSDEDYFGTEHSNYNSESISDTDTTKESESASSDASSQETKERRKATRVWRDCKPCPLDKLKRWYNRGIKWICGSYHRARRSFKSECMMRYRNCQDGTMFTKIYSHRCKNDSYHGRHWFYVYKT
ncbi:uncharacterized protein [Choristoneura fumiferana]|uniref:uncharacterized protein n=1 Tax=Choristoneura fumiferana TaxID=7141 RepID=UPI003D154DD0